MGSGSQNVVPKHLVPKAERARGRRKNVVEDKETERTGKLIAT